MYSDFSINIISLIIASILFFMFNFAFENIYNQNNQQSNTNITKEIIVSDEQKQDNQENIQEISFNWGIYIPKINIMAQISEGTTKEVMDRYVGHFIDTAVVKGNVCLGAHNRGYPVNYFENIKKLQEGDLIYYKKDEKVKKYIVKTVAVIKDTDWTYLENTEDNRITLITCVENEPDFRRCVQATEE